MESLDQVTQYLDSILSKLNDNNNPLSDGTLIKEIIELLLHCNENYFDNTDFLNHRVFVTLRDSYLNILRKWRRDAQLDDTFYFIFETVPNLFIKISNHISQNNISILKEFICHESVLNELNLCLEEIASNGKYLQDSQIRSLDNIFRAIQRLEKSCLDSKNESSLLSLFENIVKCICSPSFIEMFIHSTTQEYDSAGQKFLLHTCTDYIYSHATNQQHQQSLLDIRHCLLHPFVHWLQQQSNSFPLWNHRMAAILRQLCFILTLSIQLNRHSNLNKEIFDDYCQLIDSFVNMLYSIIQIENSITNKLALSLMGTLTSNLYTMTLSVQLEKYIKSKHIISLVFKLANINNDEIQLNTLRILSSLITEQDTKIISDSFHITDLFLKYLNKIINDSNQVLRFHNIIRCFKNLIPYDSIKDQVVQLNGIPLFIRCATDTIFKPLQVQQPALEILLALTFNKQAYNKLKDNLIHFKPLLASSHQSISRIVDALLWKLENEEENLSKPTVFDKIYIYDIMISYSHADRDLVYRIYDLLIQDNFRIWIDHDESSGTTMMTKANIINQSRYILICMSEEYKQNSFCRCEAYYAHERQSNIIPLVLTLNFHPDGWLTDIVNKKIYIDFVKLGFDLAFNTLKNEINQFDLYQKSQSIASLPQIQYPSVIEQWTNDQVNAFLVENKFHILLPMISEMNGCLLYDLYKMCNDDRASMFHTLKNELLLLDKNAQPLTLFIYLRFLREIQKHNNHKGSLKEIY